MKKLVDKIYDYLEEFNTDPGFAGAGGKNAMKLVKNLNANISLSVIKSGTILRCL
jgi:hypothetical protein